MTRGRGKVPTPTSAASLLLPVPPHPPRAAQTGEGRSSSTRSKVAGEWSGCRFMSCPKHVTAIARFGTQHTCSPQPAVQKKTPQLLCAPVVQE